MSEQASPDRDPHDEVGRNGDETVCPDSDTTHVPAFERAGDVIGRYRLLQVLGEGGFGVVYQAEQKLPIRRTVALKIIKPGMDTRQVIARFEAERQALALMDHPHIAQVLDAGTTESGRPFFVMELVRGIPLTDFCDQRSLSTTQRLELFTAVCHAVQHAHQKGVIHRDLKPSNVLVTDGDDGPLPKVIDFGIAKATHARLTDKTVFTEYRQLIGTPEYMSPEQAETSITDIDTRSDIYSLGVLLYELLTGTTPFDGKRLRSAAYGEIQRIIREEDPPRPSTRLSALGEQLDDIARHRRGDPAHLQRELKGDLDWIVMKAMEKERDRRYDTASGLADDVIRHLRHEPVLASPPSAAYRMRKLIRRHRGPAIATALVAVVLTLGIIGTTFGLLWALNERDRADAQARSSQRITDFLVGLFEASDPQEAGGEPATALDLLDRGAEQIAELGNEPETQAALSETIGYVLLMLGQIDRARPLVESALAYREAHPDNELALAGALHIRATVDMIAGSPREGRAFIERAIEIRERTLGESPELGQSMNVLGNLVWSLGDLAAAESVHRDTLAMRERIYDEDHADIAQSLHNIGALRYLQNDLAEAATIFERAIAIEARSGTDDNPSFATSIHILAIIHKDLLHLDRAMELQLQSLDIRERVMGPNHWHTALSLTVLGEIHTLRGQPELAVPLTERAIRIALDTWDENHGEVWWMQRALARAHNARGAPEDAEVVITPVLQVATPEGDPSALPLSLVVLAEAQRRQGRLDDAATSCRAAMQAVWDLDEPAPENVGRAEAELARVLREQGQPDAAITMLESALPALTEALGPDRIDTELARRDLIDTLITAGRTDDAAAHAAVLLDRTRAAADGPDADAMAVTRAASALLLCAPLDPEHATEALTNARRAANMRTGRLPVVLTTFAEALAANGDHPGAAEVQRQALELVPADSPRHAVLAAALERYREG